MEEEGVKVLTISELLQRARPLTGASSLPGRRSIPSSSESHLFPRRRNLSGPTKPVPPNQNPNPTILESLNHPTIIIGTLNLPAQDEPSTSNRTPRCPKPCSCFSFSDGSSTVCCDVIELDIGIIGRKIHVLAWNFIPFKRRGGFLEIISWKLPDTSSGVSQISSNSNVFPLASGSSTECEDMLKAWHCVQGLLESVSPVSVVSCATGARSSWSDTVPKSSGSTKFCGFLGQILVCECKLCGGKESAIPLQYENEGQNGHCFTKPLIVYFLGSASSWHPAISELIGRVVLLSGLKKKLVYIGDEESQLMYVTTEKTLLHLPKSIDSCTVSKTAIKGKGECGRYIGTITNIYMQGMVVELDQDVLLLLTDQLLILPHSLRVGAVVSARNVHFVNPKFSWTKVLVLGACFKTSISVKCFSPFETGCCIYSLSHSILGKFIDSLAFSVRLWVLLLVSSFRKKFAGILSEKEILGSKNLMWTVARCYQKEGLAQSYATSLLPSSVIRCRHGVFREYCKHEVCGCGNEPIRAQLKLVVPISNFIRHCETTWTKMLLEQETDSDFMFKNAKYSHVSCEGLSYRQSVRRIVHGEEIGVVLVGWIKISPSSGRLQLIDATGCIDVVIADLSPIWNINSIYEVNDFTLIMEGLPEQVDCSGFYFNQSFLCRSIFGSIPMMDRKVELYLLYHITDPKLRNRPFYSVMKNKGNFEELQSGRFHLLLVTHKYPVQQKFHGEQIVSISSSMFADACILPWDLFLSGKDGRQHTHPTMLSLDLLKESMELYTNINHWEWGSCKRYKTGQASSMDSSSGYEFCGCTNCSSASTCRKSYQERKCLNLSSPIEIPCFVTGRSINNQGFASSGTLSWSNNNRKVVSGCKPCAQKVLLEFKSESFCEYELLRVGGYYVLKHHEQDVLCTVKDLNDVSCHKVNIASSTHMWSLSFSSDEVLSNADLSHLPRSVDSYSSTNGALSDCPRQNEIPLRLVNGESSEIHSDFCVHLSKFASFLKEDLKLADEGLDKPSFLLEEATDISWCSGTAKTGPVQSSGTSDLEFQLPEGNLVSVHGRVLAVHNSRCSSASKKHRSSFDVHLEKFFHVTNSICIHVMVDHHIVKIVGAPSKHAYPIGFGPGTNASFYRILVLSGQNELLLTPTSFIAVEAIRVVSDYSDKYTNPSVASSVCNFVSANTLPSALISEVLSTTHCMPMQFHCRVVAIYILVLEMNKRAVYPLSRIHSRLPVLNIPLAGFVLEDGSSSCCCWADFDSAATLLRLNEEISHEITGRSILGSKKNRVDDICGDTISNRLDKILKKHDRIIVKNYGSMFDSSGQDLSFCSDTAISSSDEDLVKFVILNACFNTVWTVVGSRMDSNAMGQLEQRLTEVEMAMPPNPIQNQNVWATQVYCANPLSEARNSLQQLLNM